MNTEQICFKIISLAGESFSKMVEALTAAKNKEFKKSEELIEESREILHEAHGIHAELLTAEANGNNPEVSILLVHAQDNLMNTVLAETFFTEMIQIYKDK
ncbi:PTS lactose/cellobiose transporter subunit IIA [Clostridium tertium]|jgi:lactose PTS system EIIA component|uniref:PTS lactose/cellobiose transporter subunit IIA n=1 Tax=Clostridium TaxID=1485 RepID=UPI00115A304D|nr:MULTISPECIES: PTS lactose/cellobiose transporter subunit IIA [Clostridium]MBS4958850.1 PTS lactose/cellobiose transporter subunit IIA [Clostridium sp.]MDB1921627.1 PTS lactose/cellobiose transporter subunit IIA [Clostridium tertium]MDB1924831.1 PTS lactose/cellobiose transporter subunit IIA [Clostridium tertium]MDB1930562.1 PTS lactose/cellobiose transporter subunit IIA [Clostridium tertium]MDU2155981.1 PTS lactose/cellobiose transporter subunit IIA [Clostridium sp.]